MLFSSVIFLFFFLPVVLSLYLLPSKRWRNYWFLLASFAFYLWSEGSFVLVLFASIAGNYLIGIWLDRANARRRKTVLILGTCFNLGILAFFKYTNFMAANLNALLDSGGGGGISIATVYAPLGISFFTFHSISYLVDAYRGSAPIQKDPAGLAIYLAAFPKILAGPITQYRNIAGQLSERVLTSGGFLYGVERFITGLAKKVLLANPLAAIADAAFSLPESGLDAVSAWAGIFCYTLQIYFDFSGYSDMAIGLGKMFGFDFPENFNFPYISRSVREFWQRWHISLSTWFRDYLYIPLGGNRCGEFRNFFNLFIVFLLCGLWHGPSWNFVFWGAWHGLFLALERTRFGDLLRSAWRPLRHLYLMSAIMIGWVFFRADSFGFALAYLKALSGFGDGLGSGPHFALLFNSEVFAIGIIAVVLCFPVSVSLRKFFFSSGRVSPSPRGAVAFCFSAAYAAIFSLLLLMSCMSLAGGTHKAFIYFKF